VESTPTFLSQLVFECYFFLVDFFVKLLGDIVKLLFEDGFDGLEVLLLDFSQDLLAELVEVLPNVVLFGVFWLLGWEFGGLLLSDWLHVADSELVKPEDIVQVFVIEILIFFVFVFDRLYFLDF
jgi:hypothetical protein